MGRLIYVNPGRPGLWRRTFSAAAAIRATAFGNMGMNDEKETVALVQVVAHLRWAFTVLVGLHQM